MANGAREEGLRRYMKVGNADPQCEDLLGDIQRGCNEIRKILRRT